MSKYLFQCFQDECRGRNNSYIFEAVKPICPLCSTEPPHIGTVVRVHYGIHDKNGKVKGYMGKKVKIACDANDWVSPFSCVSAYIPMVNCPSCMKTEVYKLNWFPVDPENPLEYMNNPQGE